VSSGTQIVIRRPPSACFPLR